MTVLLVPCQCCQRKEEDSSKATGGNNRKKHFISPLSLSPPVPVHMFTTSLLISLIVTCFALINQSNAVTSSFPFVLSNHPASASAIFCSRLSFRVCCTSSFLLVSCCPLFILLLTMPLLFIINMGPGSWLSSSSSPSVLQFTDLGASANKCNPQNSRPTSKSFCFL